MKHLAVFSREAGACQFRRDYLITETHFEPETGGPARSVEVSGVIVHV